MDWKRITDEVEFRTNSIMQNSFSYSGGGVRTSTQTPYLQSEPKVLGRINEIEDHKNMIQKIRDDLLG